MTKGEAHIEEHLRVLADQALLMVCASTTYHTLLGPVCLPCPHCCPSWPCHTPPHTISPYPCLCTAQCRTYLLQRAQLLALSSVERIPTRGSRWCAVMLYGTFATICAMLVENSLPQFRLCPTLRHQISTALLIASDNTSPTSLESRCQHHCLGCYSYSYSFCLSMNAWCNHPEAFLRAPENDSKPTAPGK